MDLFVSPILLIGPKDGSLEVDSPREKRKISHCVSRGNGGGLATDWRGFFACSRAMLQIALWERCLCIWLNGSMTMRT